MSQIKNNLLLQGASGTLGKLFVFRVIRGKLIICNRPRKADKLTDHQTKMRDLFLKAVQYARTQMEIPEAKAAYAKKTNDNKHSAYVVALTDYLKPPVINEIDASRYTGLAGDSIHVRATDDFKVVSVHVIIRNGEGVVVEQGDASLPPYALDEWQYITTVANLNVKGCKIEARASDMPGNVTVAEYGL